jgi:hypothetical protein
VDSLFAALGDAEGEEGEAEAAPEPAAKGKKKKVRGRPGLACWPPA